MKDGSNARDALHRTDPGISALWMFATTHGPSTSRPIRRSPTASAYDGVIPAGEWRFVDFVADPGPPRWAIDLHGKAS